MTEPSTSQESDAANASSARRPTVLGPYEEENSVPTWLRCPQKATMRLCNEAMPRPRTWRRRAGRKERVESDCASVVRVCLKARRTKGRDRDGAAEGTRTASTAMLSRSSRRKMGAGAR